MTFRVRRLDENGDMTFGQGSANYLVDSPDAVAQVMGTRLKLFTGEWFLDNTQGTPWLTQVMSQPPNLLADQVIRGRMAGTPYVTSIENYQSVFNADKRLFTVTATDIFTAFGRIPFSTNMGLSPDIFELDESPLDGGSGLGL